MKKVNQNWIRGGGAFLVVTAFALLAGASAFGKTSSPYGSVDMKIGTGFEGHTIISAARPFGLVKPGPDTEKRRNFLDSKFITGFSQLHMSGTGGNAQSGVVGVMPTAGELVVDPKGYRSSFTPEDSSTDLDSIRFLLESYGIETEIAATERVGIYRHTFPKGKESRVLVDVSHSFNKFRGGEIRIVSDSALEGTGRYRGYHGSQFDVAF